MEQFTLTKKIAKHGKQNIIIIPNILKEELKPNTIVRINIDIIKKPEAQE